MEGAVILENGQTFYGKLFGSLTPSPVAEVVFNTGMVGYQEVMTDPSYKGQMVVMTYPLMGNYGLNSEDMESIMPQVSGFIVKEACKIPSNWRLGENLERFLARHNITGITGIDTRKLTRVLRERGTMKGMIVPLVAGEVAPVYREILEASPLLDNPVARVTTKQSYTVPGSGKRVVVMDFGIKKSILDQLKAFDLELIVVPSFTGAKDILALNPDGLFLSNGPGDPQVVKSGINTAKVLLDKLPVFGICLGLQVLALAMGGETYKLKFGHRGINHPVKDLRDNRVYITSQNHGYAVREDTLPDDTYVTHVNLNDGTVEGFAHKCLPVMAVQFHPEASPGPEDSRYLFKKFFDSLNKGPLA
ncbi:MAG: carbamoyl-phosphate synthase small subunit [Peptococcaceae bacterium]|jgi:carbamoyl-phosphate synthase small subunit|nr:carbamoyl-phosphate synthase small subunit [Peptococcaceae bacterium]